MFAKQVLSNFSKNKIFGMTNSQVDQDRSQWAGVYKGSGAPLLSPKRGV